jgi:hypothetical protein
MSFRRILLYLTGFVPSSIAISSYSFGPSYAFSSSSPRTMLADVVYYTNNDLCELQEEWFCTLLAQSFQHTYHSRTHIIPIATCHNWDSTVECILCNSVPIVRPRIQHDVAKVLVPCLVIKRVSLPRKKPDPSYKFVSIYWFKTGNSVLA